MTDPWSTGRCTHGETWDVPWGSGTVVHTGLSPGPITGDLGWVTSTFCASVSLLDKQEK